MRKWCPKHQGITGACLCVKSHQGEHQQCCEYEDQDVDIQLWQTPMGCEAANKSLTGTQFSRAGCPRRRRQSRRAPAARLPQGTCSPCKTARRTQRRQPPLASSPAANGVAASDLSGTAEESVCKIIAAAQQRTQFLQSGAAHAKWTQCSKATKELRLVKGTCSWPSGSCRVGSSSPITYRSPSTTVAVCSAGRKPFGLQSHVRDQHHDQASGRIFALMFSRCRRHCPMRISIWWSNFHWCLRSLAAQIQPLLRGGSICAPVHGKPHGDGREAGVSNRQQVHVRICARRGRNRSRCMPHPCQLHQRVGGCRCGFEHGARNPSMTLVPAGGIKSRQ